MEVEAPDTIMRRSAKAAKGWRKIVNKDPATLPWREVKKVDHYYLSVDAMQKPLGVREEPSPLGGQEQ